MDGFSFWHLAIVLFTIFLWVWPLWLIIQRTGNPGPVALLAIVPVVGMIILWWLALGRWPAMDPSKPQGS